MVVQVKHKILDVKISFPKNLLCVFRRRWKQIVENYIRSPHAESMRKRNWWVQIK